MKRPVLEWRLYALHRSGMKVEDRKQAAGAGEWFFSLFLFIFDVCDGGGRMAMGGGEI